VYLPKFATIRDVDDESTPANDLQTAGNLAPGDSESAGAFLFHYTSLGAAIERILPSEQFRLSRLSEMRDPRESQVWPVAASFYGDGPAGAEPLFWDINRRVNAVKDTCRVMSLTQDDLTRDAGERWGRGFARPRLWEQYAEVHRGVCLCFDRNTLAAIASSRLTQLGRLEHGPVTYRDRPAPLTVLLDAATADNAEALAQDVLDKSFSEVFFQKATDWESEHEYRFVLRTSVEEDTFLPLHPSLRHVILGWRTPAPYLPSLKALCEPFGIQIWRLTWWDGRPVITHARWSREPPDVPPDTQLDASEDAAPLSETRA
jgi:hypothetical protein